jgi:phage terminase small subunit
LAVVISDEAAERFAQALITHGGIQSQAAIACGYTSGTAARTSGMMLSRHPKVLKALQPLVIQHLQALTPRAVQALSGLLTNKSGYIRLEAAKDILDRNGVGTSQEQLRTQPLVIRINLGTPTVQSSAQPVLEQMTDVSSHPGHRPGGRKTGNPEATRSPAHDFSPEASAGSPAHGFSPEALAAAETPKLTAESVSRPLELDTGAEHRPQKSFNKRELDL